jgi:hypothetical protein
VWLASALCVLIILQLTLGVGTYVVKFSWPAWLGEYQFAAAHVVREKSLMQSLITTAHVAMGSLILFVATALAVRTARVFFGRARCNDAAPFVWLAGGAPATLGRVA